MHKHCLKNGTLQMKCQHVKKRHTSLADKNYEDEDDDDKDDDDDDNDEHLSDGRFL